MSTSTLPLPHHEGTSQPTANAHVSVRARDLQLLRKEINFIPNPNFRGKDSSEAACVDAILSQLRQFTNAPRDLPPQLRQICQSDLLTHEQEAALFREMNYVKFRANALRSRIDPDDMQSATLPAAEFIGRAGLDFESEPSDPGRV